jgi:hypothetical protein
MSNFFPLRPAITPSIYAYEELNNPELTGFLKVGFTSGDVQKRVARQYPTARPGKSSLSRRSVSYIINSSGEINYMKKCLLLLCIFVILPLTAVSAQMLAVKAKTDFYQVWGGMERLGKQLKNPADITDFLTDAIRSSLNENFVYRVAFIGEVTARCGFNTGQSSLANTDGTINALTGFLMPVEGNNDVQTWTVKELSGRYDRLLQTSWQHTHAGKLLRL